MSNHSLPLAVLFADISGSTALYEELGNTSAQRLVSQWLACMCEVVQKHDGTVIKTIGDEVLSVFSTVDQAAWAACALQACLGPQLTVVPQVRVGFHYGPVIRSPEDVFGDAVNVAARMVSLAKAGQVLTTQQTVSHLTPAFRSGTRHIEQALVKGKREAIAVYEVIWQGEGLTTFGSERSSALPTQGQLKLRLGQQHLELNAQRATMSVGRERHNDLTIQNEFTSRIHARIEYRRGKFFLIDQSTNGTFVRIEGEITYLRREEMLLRGQGEISLGLSLENPSPDVIYFQLC
ncbi:adenylate/guanylate cyclase domain-containing protein [Candidatus Cyanaurora vandensis]|uniref:adenylate/guanylate cyclase domain-containing protein n=1 Tax=Candidatus Cyanaurora vandensis TaxID=2714958 RepID=UPI0025804A4C|nr:adenylate/guanylate cyclase domain-containing protein [Candidatus Cyanaurora vandensis]